MKTKATRFQALFRYFPDRPWGTEYGTFRTLQISGRPLRDLPATLYEDIARLITGDYWRRLERESLASKSRGRYKDLMDGSREHENAEDVKKAEEFLSQLSAGEASAYEEENTSGVKERKQIAPESIEIIEVNEDSTIRSEVFPAFFVCEACKRYYFLDRNGTDSLKCSAHEGKPASLHQVDLVFSCARCANIEVLLPFSIQARGLRPGSVRCNNGHDITLDLSKGLANARWDCTGTDCDFWKSERGVDKRRLTRQCYCNVVSDPNAEYLESPASVMAPRPANTGDIASPLIVSYIKDSLGNDLELDGLRNLHRDYNNSFSLTGLEPSSKSILQGLGVTEFFSVSEIQSMTINYGYRSMIHSIPDVPVGERYSRFYQPQPRAEKFKAYLVSVVGKGVAIGFDKNRLSRLALSSDESNNDYTFSGQSERELQGIARTPFQELLTLDHKRCEYRISKFLHSIEHALLNSLILELGIDDFDARILVNDGAIVIFETRNLEDGGIDQIAKQPDLVYRWITRTLEKIQNCPQYCDVACMACIRSDNASCHGFIFREFPRWMPPNVLLDRHIAIDWVSG